MKNNERTTMQIRLSQHLYDELKRIAEATGNSINGTLAHMAYLGLRLYKEGTILPQNQKE